MNGLSRMHVVLVVDDEAHFVTLSQVFLQRAGFKTLAATDARTGLQMVYDHSPDIILLDDMMPGMYGSEMCQILKADPRWSHIPIIMHTAGARLKTQEHVDAIGADAVIFKPAMPQDLINTITRLLKINA
jgi:two-component system phosphate regulon response regulator PhoB